MTRVGTGAMRLLLLIVTMVSCEAKVTLESLGNLLDVTWRLPEPQGAPRTACEKDLRDVYTNLRNMTMTLWANEIWDSSGRAPSGLLQGSVYQLGNFGGCLGEDERAPLAGRPGPARQYCLVKVALRNKIQEERHSTLVESFDLAGSAYNKIYYSGEHSRLPRNIIHWGVCAPASCGRSELEALLQQHFSRQTLAWNRTGTEDPEFRVSIDGTSCQVQKDPAPFTPGALLFIWLAAILISFAVSTTLYHWYLIRHKPEDKNPAIVKVYSMIYHLKNLTKRDTSGLDILWGLRFFSIIFIIMDHRFGTTISGPLSNREYLEEKYNGLAAVIVFHGDLLVDSFLVLSGLLSSYGLLRAMLKFSSYPVVVILRYVRLAPAFAAVILFTAEILPLTGSGPLWSAIVEPEGEYCRHSWWTNMLMLGNYINTKQMCMVHAWYIPCDFHYFLASLIICSLFRLRSRIVPVLLVLLLAAILTPALITYYLQLPGTLLFYNDFLTAPREDNVFQNVYIGSHTRAGPYLLGMLAGYLIAKYHKPGTKRISTIFSVIGTMVSVALMLATMATGTIFYDDSRPYSALESSFYAGLHRSVWATGLCLMIMCGTFGHIPILSMLLSCSVWIPLGKLVYGAYLVHMSLQLRSVGLARQPYHMDITVLLGQVLGDVVMSFSLALVLYLTVEGPMKQMAHLLMGSRKKRSPVDEGVYSQAGHTNRAMVMDIETEAVPPITADKAHYKEYILRMFTNTHNTIYDKNIKNIHV